MGDARREVNAMAAAPRTGVLEVFTSPLLAAEFHFFSLFATKANAAGAISPVSNLPLPPLPGPGKYMKLSLIPGQKKRVRWLM